MSIRTTRGYDKEFKINAVKLYLSSGKKYHEISKELGIPMGTLVTWVMGHKKYGESAFPGTGHLRPSDAEVADLRKELELVREERDILKKALGIFSSRQK